MVNLIKLLAGGLAATLICGTAHCTTVLLGPIQYKSFADSPFAPGGDQPLPGIFVEDFEDGLFNAPGVTGISNTPGTSLAVSFGFNINGDSVDGDDGTIDGFGRGGNSLAADNNLSSDDLGYTFIFDPVALGGLPTHAGIVWTDGSPFASTQVEFFGPGGVSLGVIGPTKISDAGFDGRTDEDHFFGAVNTDGIESFTIRSPGGTNNMTVDHLQYGPIPEPASATLLVVATLVLARRREQFD